MKGKWITGASEKKIGNKYTVEEALLTMRNLKCKVFDNELIISESTKEQEDLCEKAGLQRLKLRGFRKLFNIFVDFCDSSKNYKYE